MKKLAMLLFVLALCVQAADAASVVIDLGTASSFGVLAGSGVTNSGNTDVNGDVGSSPTPAITGFPPGEANGVIYRAAGPVVVQAKLDLTTAYNAAVAAPDGNNITGVDLSGMTLEPNIYDFNTTAIFSAGDLTLDGGGNPGAQWIFKIGTGLTTASDFNVVLINGAEANNVFWQVGSSATIGIRNNFVGSILANTSITLNGTGTLNGRALAQNGAVTISTAEDINIPNFVPSEANVPNVVGMTQADANTAIVEAGLVVGTITDVFSNTVAAGSVISQVPVGGTAAAGGSDVNLVISLGPPIVRMVLVYRVTTAINPMIDYEDTDGLRADIVKDNLSAYVVFDVNTNHAIQIGINDANGNPDANNNPTAILFGKDGRNKFKMTLGGKDPNTFVNIFTFGEANSIKPFVITNLRNTPPATQLAIRFGDLDATNGFDIETSLFGKNTTTDIGTAARLSVAKSLKGQVSFAAEGRFVVGWGAARARLDLRLTKDANKNNRTVQETVAHIQTIVLSKTTDTRTVLPIP